MSSLPITFEPASVSDAEALAALRVTAMRESLERVGRFDVLRARARFLNTFSPQETLKILERGELAGCLVLRRTAEGLLLDHLYVLPSHQNRGLGAAALRKVFAIADVEKKDVRVGALRDSDSNRFYVRHGFELVEQAEFDNYYVRKPQRAL